MLDKALIIDDSPLIHQMYRLVFKRFDCQFVDAYDGQQGLDMLAAGNDIDLILLDINMPVMNGVQFLEKAALRGIPARIPIIVISTEGKEEDTLRALKLGAKGYLRKPFNPSELHTLVERIFPPEALRAAGGQ
jgi:two-component system chemotaxis response regulator CheY